MKQKQISAHAQNGKFIGVYLGKNSSNDFGRINSRSIAIKLQKETPTLSANGNANAANK